MNETCDIFEKYVFFSSRKDREIQANVLETILVMPLGRVTVTWSDRPDEEYTTFNDRTRKILLNLDKPDRIESIRGEFELGGTFELRGRELSIAIPAEQYNYEVVDSMKRFLSPIFPLCVFKNPYIWGVDLYEDYERDHFFSVRQYSARSQHLEDPELDIFRRDGGIVYKLRFHLREEQPIDTGIHHLFPLFEGLLDSLGKRAYEGLEVMHRYCTDRAAFRQVEPRTKLGKDLKAVLSPR
ncbi:MAG TPA: hypothetical protein VIV61_17200 [Candidatus Ozemobacteraceae bacterium]